MRTAVDPKTGEIDYDEAILLDAEDLAERGVRTAYEQYFAPVLSELGIRAAPVRESADDVHERYAVEALGVHYDISSPTIGQADSWGNATFALFDIVNRQLEHLDVKLYALYGGNDLQGIFTTAKNAELARRALPRKLDWPYLATPDTEWNGAYHD